MKAFGMPGPGGSLGQCALCGINFMGVVLGVENMRSFTVDGCDQTLYGHDHCLKAFNGKEWTDLPKSPLRMAFDHLEKFGGKP